MALHLHFATPTGNRAQAFNFNILLLCLLLAQLTLRISLAALLSTYCMGAPPSGTIIKFHVFLTKKTQSDTMGSEQES
jgi:hypothetical protein